MYNRLADGRYRIEAAKQVLVDLVAGLPTDGDLHVGLRVYGARLHASDDGACEDSHLDVPIAGVDRSALTSAVEGTLARGATPIALSLRLAAEDLPATGARRVVLVTDGLESCGGDLAAVAELYAEHGIDLRIVGFDLDPTSANALAAIAEFTNTFDAAELSGALHDALADVTVEALDLVPVEVIVTRAGEPTIDGVSVAFLNGVDGRRVVFETSATGAFEAQVPPGGYEAELVDAYADGRVAHVPGLTVDPDHEASFTFEIAPPFAVDVVVTPEAPYAGTSVTVAFTGAPIETLGLVAIAPTDAPDSTRLYQAYVSTAEGEVDLLTPDVPGTFEARYYLTLPEGGQRVIGRSAPFETVPATASLSAPARVATGTRFDVAWTGPAGQGDSLVLVPVTVEGSGSNSAAAAGEGDASPAVTPRAVAATARLFTNPVVMLAPTAVGEYELLYLTGQSGTELTALRVEVIAAEVTMAAPRSVAANSIFEIEVGGAVGPQDFIVLVRAGAPDADAEWFGPPRRIYGAQVGTRAPAEPGEYELRYLTVAGEILERLPLTVE